MKPMADFELMKGISTEKDFEQMGWHDATVYGLRLNNDLELDIDYILQWNEPDLEGFKFTFWVAPATLVFKNIKNLRLEVEINPDKLLINAIEIDDIERTRKGHTSHWTIITHQGDIEFDSDGYEQFIRREPSFEFGPSISFIERNGFSLEKTTNQEIPKRLRDDIIKRRKKESEQYENAKKRHLIRQEKERLNKARDNNEIDLKQYLLKKREIKKMLDYYDDSLKSTRFESW
jgi:hypothetical protein